MTVKNIHKIFTDGAVTVDKSQATKEAPCGAVLPHMHFGDEKCKIETPTMSEDISIFQLAVVVLLAVNTFGILLLLWGSIQ